MKNYLIAAGLACLVGLPAMSEEKKDEPKASEWTGKLQTGVVAIGAETTGTIIVTKNGRFELDLGKNKDLREKADKLSGKEVTVTGKLTIRKGVEVRERRIIEVTSLKEAEAK